MRNLDPHLLRAFIAVGDIGTVNGAATALHRTQAAVSMQIRRLEEQFDLALFRRSSRGLELTHDGLLLMPYAKEILRLSLEACTRLGGKRMEGRVKIGVVEDFAATRLLDMLKMFRDIHPDVHMDIVVAGNRDLATLFDANKVDLLICDTAELAHKPLVVWREQLYWIVRSDVVVSADKPLPLILFTDNCPWRRRVVDALASSGVRWNLVCEASTLVAMSTAVQVGIGIGPMFASTVPAGCRRIDQSSDFPEAIDIEIGMYLRSDAPEEAHYIADLVCRAPDDALAKPESNFLRAQRDTSDTDLSRTTRLVATN